LTHAIEFAFEAPLAQHALSPANALDAMSIAAATRAVVVILIMVKPETDAMQELFNLFVGYPACHSERSEESRIVCPRRTK
jgi:hypothetical protein